MKRNRNGIEPAEMHAAIATLVDGLNGAAVAVVNNFALPQRGPCVYMLMRRGRVMYVGQTINLLSRLGHHFEKKRGHYKFDAVQYVMVPRRCLLLVEFSLIREFRPPYNRVCPSDAEFCIAQNNAADHLARRARFYKSRGVAPSISPALPIQIRNFAEGN